MNKLFYFKITFIFVTVGTITYSTFVGLLDADTITLSSFGHLFLKNVIVGIVVGCVLGLLNMYYKIWPFKKL